MWKDEKSEESERNENLAWENGGGLNVRGVVGRTRILSACGEGYPRNGYQNHVRRSENWREKSLYLSRWERDRLMA